MSEAAWRAEGTAPPLRAVVADNVRRIRLARGLSLRELAELTGVSKALLSQIERGVANPTIEVLSRVAAALGESFLELARPRLAGPEVLRRADADAAAGTEPSVRTLFGSWERRRFELSEGDIPPHTSSVRNSHGAGSVEYAYVVAGSVTLSAADWSVSLGAGDAVRFAADHDHVYTTADEAVRVLTLLSLDGP